MKHVTRIRYGSPGRKSTVVGEWSVVSDSSWQGVGLYVIQDALKVYAGLPGDYWDFRTDGFVYVKEGAMLDTLSYTLNGSNEIIIENFGWDLNSVQTPSTIRKLTGHDAVIRSSDFQPPSGLNRRVLYLRK